MAALATLTEIAVPRPEVSLMVTVQTPAANGVIAYVAAPLALDLAATLAIAPESGLHVSLSVNAPV